MTYQAPDLASVPRHADVTELELNAPRLERLDGIAQLPSLRSLSVRRAKRLTDLSAAPDARALETVFFDGAAALTDIGALADVLTLRDFTAWQCRHLKSVEPLRRCPRLRSLQLVDGSTVTDGAIRWAVEDPRLARGGLLVQHRRHYDVTRAELDAACVQRQMDPATREMLDAVMKRVVKRLKSP
ncbi:MAG: hypothetical protein K8T90_07045 [Planctomycetes bacterium]|nr:hypothetical protein [Planctomycetota bacterium]